MSLETLIGGLTREEQIVAMELLWKRLTTEHPSAAPPEWHRSIVAERVAAIERGEEQLADWADAKKRLADPLRSESNSPPGQNAPSKMDAISIMTSTQAWQFTFMTAFLRTLILCCYTQEFTPALMDGTTRLHCGSLS